MGKPAAISDFLVDTNGHCFICLTRTSAQSQFKSDELGQRPAATPFTSVQALSQYLKMDMSQVFHEKESIPSELLDSVKRSKLKVSRLCEQCSKWNKKIAELYRRLEKIQTEANFYVERIHRSLTRSKKDVLISKLGDETNSDARLLEKMRIVKALRTEAIEKCSSKLKTDGQPRVNVRNLTTKQAFSKMQRFKFESRRKTAEVNHPELGVTDGDGDHHIKTEGPDTDKDDYFDNDDGPESMDIMDRTNSNDDENELQNYEGDNLPINPTAPTANKNVTSGRRASRTVAKSSVKVLPSTSSINNVQKLTYIINPETDKFKCNICSVEFKHTRSLKRHYNSIHLKIKHKCNLCGKEFSQISHYNTHHRVAHVGVRFKCSLCGKCFTEKRILFKHQQSAHLVRAKLK